MTDTFDTDPGWEQFNMPFDGNDLGYSATNYAGTGAGEIGGAFSRTGGIVWYGDTDVGQLQPSTSISASGSVNPVSVDSGYNSNSFIGHFDRDGFSDTWPAGTEGVNGVGFHFSEQTIDSLRVFYRVGLSQGELFTIEGLNTARIWSYEYLPDAGDFGSFSLSISGIGGGFSTIELSEEQRSSIGTLDTFGLAVGPLGGSLDGNLQLYVDDVTYSSASSVPEPTTLGLFAAGLAGLGFSARRRKQAH